MAKCAALAPPEQCRPRGPRVFRWDGIRGALAGILIGGGGTVIATEGNDVELKPGTVLRMRFDSALNVAR